eukprot:TRINITY_DN14580_c0_g1_i1.p1 TRINITY_DN14580_c0_g1~~TRINITY_DN14580_c0_g1_i1.p1  ORF type:complete len:412 (-),score=69.35 TRINITY_DN14580_c0_g1_i1:148-1338(-)
MACCTGRRCAGLVAILASFVYWIFVPPFSNKHLVPNLVGSVAVVTGGSRGIGKGIAIGLGEAGASVYITGRSLNSGGDNTGGIGGKPAPGSLEETCEAVVRAGGKCIAVAADSSKDDDLKALFDRVIEEQGHLDILVNNAFSAVSYLPGTMGQPFWEKGLEAWDQVNNVGLRSHYVASTLAAQKMSPLKRGLIINVASFGGLDYMFDVAYGIGKAAMDRMANDMAVELFTENITMVSLWPGLVKTENVESGALDESLMSERRGKAPGIPDFAFADWFPTPLAETPLFNGRAVAAFARDPRKIDYTGKILVPSVMAYGYGIVDERGVRSPPMTSLKAIFSVFFFQSLLKKHGIWEIPGGCYTPKAEASENARFFWNTLPDISIPGKLLKLAAGAPNL